MDEFLGIDLPSDKFDETDEESEDFQKLEKLYQIIKRKNIPELIRKVGEKTDSINIPSLIDGAYNKC